MAAPPTFRRISVGQAVDEYMDHVQSQVTRDILAPTTATNYARDLADFARLAGPDSVLDDLSGPDVDNILLRYQREPDARYKNPNRKPGGPGRSARATNRLRQSLSRFLTHATQHGWVQANPMLWASPPAKVRTPLRPERTALPEASAAALLAATTMQDDDSTQRRRRGDQRLADRDTLLVAALLLLGPRVSEVCAANVDDITSNGDGTGRWRITGKGGKTRTVPLPEPLFTVYREYRDSLRGDLLARASETSREDSAHAVFLSWRGRRITPDAVRDVIDKATARVDPALRRRATPHALRHTTATTLVASGWDVKVVARLLGHASIATTDVYLDPVEGELAAAVAGSSIAGVLRPDA